MRFDLQRWLLVFLGYRWEAGRTDVIGSRRRRALATTLRSALLACGAPCFYDALTSCLRGPAASAAAARPGARREEGAGGAAGGSLKLRRSRVAARAGGLHGRETCERAWATGQLRAQAAQVMEFGIIAAPRSRDHPRAPLPSCTHHHHHHHPKTTVTMPRPPSKHGLERKYKSWRKGKSAKAKSKGSLKQQLRGKERLLCKLPETETERRQEMEQQIQELKTEIENKQVVEKERQNAKDSHGLRFLERQRLTRNERSTRKLLAGASTREEKTRFEAELQMIALDQMYVAHFPHDMRYIPLFRNGVRMVDVNARKLARRATTRKRILKNLGEDRVKWIAADQYERLPSEWSVDMEKKTFAAPVNGDTAEAEINDNRFASSAACRVAGSGRAS